MTVDADVRAAARAEAAFGAGRPFDSFGYVTVGTGISSTFVRDGEPWLGAHGAAQLLGTARLTLPCPHCGRMLDVSLEDMASGAGIVRRYGDRSGVVGARGSPHRMSGRLADRVVLVTGAGSGIGEAICLRFAEEGAEVVVTTRDPDHLARSLERVKAVGTRAPLGLRTDVTDA